MTFAEEAMRSAGLKPKSNRPRRHGRLAADRDGPADAEPVVGEHNLHSPLEFTCLEEMEIAVKVLVELAQLWGKEK